MRIAMDRRVWPGALVFAFLLLVTGFVYKPYAIPASFLLLSQFVFFRDPQRKIPEGGGLVSPADGKVVEISPVFENRFLKEEAVKVGIFLSVFVPHVNRTPVDGLVRYLHYEPGAFLNALRRDSINKNESNWIGIEGGNKRVLFRQMSGAIARRICCDVKLGQPVKRGEKVGIICYGSRVECFFPKRSFQLRVRLGDGVKAGETILGEWV